MAARGDSREKYQLANERRRWLSYRRVWKAYRKLQAVRVGYISNTEIAVAAKSDSRTVKKALSFSEAEISLQLKEAFRSVAISSSNRDQDLVLANAPLIAAVGDRTTDEHAKRLKAKRLQESLDFEAELKRQKGIVGDGVSLRLKGRARKTFLERHRAPSRWKETKQKLGKLLRFKKKGKQMEEDKQEPEEFLPANCGAYQKITAPRKPEPIDWQKAYEYDRLIKAQQAAKYKAQNDKTAPRERGEVGNV